MIKWIHDIHNNISTYLCLNLNLTKAARQFLVTRFTSDNNFTNKYMYTAELIVPSEEKKDRENSISMGRTELYRAKRKSIERIAYIRGTLKWRSGPQ